MLHKKYSINDALRLLKSGLKLQSTTFPERHFRLIKDKVLVSSTNESYVINTYDFLDLFTHEKFMVVNDIEEEEVDPKKDEEYYSFRQ